MAEIANLVVALSSKGVEVVKAQIKKLGEQSAATEKQAKSLGDVIGKVGAAVAGGAFFQAVIANTIESETALAQLNATLKSTGGAAGLSSEQMVAMAQGLQKVTTFGDDAIISAEALLATFTKVGKETFPTATETILDMSTALKQDLKSSAVQLGKALNDPIAGISALSKVGVSFSDAQKEVIKSLVETGDVAGAQAMILQELQVEFGGSARAARDTFGGAITALHNAFGDLLEGSGGNLTEAKASVESLTAALSDPAVQQAFGTIVAGIFDVTAAIAGALPEMVAFTRWASEELGVSARQGTSQLVHLSDEIAEIEERLAKRRDGFSLFAGAGSLDADTKNLANLKNEYAELMDFESQRSLALSQDAATAAAAAEAAKAQAAERARIAQVRVTDAAAEKTASDMLSASNKAEAAARKEAAVSAREKAAALAIEKTATDALLKAQAETVRRMAEEQAHKDSQKTLLGQVDPVVGQQQKHELELQQLRTLNAAKLIEDQRYLELKTQAETAHDEQMRVLQEENFRRQSYGNELLMASLDQLQVGATNALVGLATGANNGEEAVRQLATSILNEGVGALVQMGVQYVKNAVMSQAATAATTATSVTAAATTAAAWSPAAAAASIASFGGAAASGLAGMAAAIPAMIGLMSFEGGGFTGSGSRSGGMDGKGGFPAMVHPNETIIDHTKGQSAGGNVTVNVIESAEKAGTQEKSTGADGAEVVNVFVADIFGDGPRARALQSAFGLKRSGK